MKIIVCAVAFIFVLTANVIAASFQNPTSIAVDKPSNVYVIGTYDNNHGLLNYEDKTSSFKIITNKIYDIDIDKKSGNVFVMRYVDGKKGIGTLIKPKDVVDYAKYLNVKPKLEDIRSEVIKKAIYPSHISTGPNDNIYAVGSDVYRQGNGRVAIIDPKDGHTILAFGEFTDKDTPYGLWNPRGIAVDKEGDIYVANQGPYCVKKFGPKGEFLAQWGARGTAEGEFMNPMGIAVDPRNSDVYVLDSYEPPGKFDLNEQMRVQKFTKDGKFIKKWGERWWIRWPISWNNLKEQLMWALYIDRSVIMPKIAIVPTIEEPSGIAVDSKGYVYIAERRKYRVNKFTSNGRLVKRWGRKGNGPGEFLFDVSGRSISMAVDADDNVYVVDHDNNRVQKFSSNGRFLTEIK